MRNILNVGVIGAGAISDTYLTNLSTLFDGLKLVAICANHLERAQAKAEKYGIRACTLEEMLADESIQMVIVLTPVGAHYGIIKQALEAGKHVYTEKTICETTDQARELMALADAKGLYLGAAPDTFMGTAFQTARKAIDDGLIGEVNSFSLSINRNNDILTGVFPFLRLPGAGVLRDYQVYYLTALISLLGPAETVGAFVRAPYPKRVNPVPGTKGYGEEIDTPNESVIAAMLMLESGVTGTIHENHETMLYDRADFAIYGTKGVLLLGNPNNFGDPVRLLWDTRAEEPIPQILEPVGAYSDNVRGLGAAEMAVAIAEGRKNRASKDLASHVLDILESMEKSSREGKLIEVTSTCERPALFTEKV